MKKIVFILVFIAGMTAGVHSASAQYCMDYGTISRKGADLYSGETKLSAEEVCSLLAETAEIPYSYYESTRKGFNAGKGMLIGFGALTGAGLVTLGVGAAGMFLEGMATGIGMIFTIPLAAMTGEKAEIDFNYRFYQVTMAGLIATGTGIRSLAAATAVFCVYKKRMNGIVKSCNYARLPVMLSCGAQKNGIGLAVNF